MENQGNPWNKARFDYFLDESPSKWSQMEEQSDGYFYRSLTHWKCAHGTHAEEDYTFEG